MRTEFDKDDQEPEHSAHHHDHPREASDTPPASALLQYMLEHNNHHAEELHALAHRLEESGRTVAAEAASRALDLYQQGNSELSRALEALSQDNR